MSYTQTESLEIVREIYNSLPVGPGAVKSVSESCRVKAAVSTGDLALLYSLDEDTMEMLSEYGPNENFIRSTDTPKEIVSYITDFSNSYTWLETEAGDDPTKLTEDLLKSIHENFSENLSEIKVEDSKGKETKFENSPGKYRSHNNPLNQNEHIASSKLKTEMSKLLKEYAASKKIIPLKAAELHNGFLKISPFDALNDIVARALASAAFLQEGYLPLAITGNYKDEYLKAMDDTEALAELFAKIQQEALLEAIAMEITSQKSLRKKDLAVALLNTEKGPEAIDEDSEKAKDIAADLWEEALIHLERLSAEYNQSGNDRWDNSFVDKAGDDDERRRYWYQYQIIKSARDCDYWASPQIFHMWLKLGLNGMGGRFEMLVTFHCMGQAYRGVIAAAMCCYHRPAGQNMRNIVNLTTLCTAPFIIDKNIDVDEKRDDFLQWLDDGITQGLEKSQESVDPVEAAASARRG